MCVYLSLREIKRLVRLPPHTQKYLLLSLAFFFKLAAAHFWSHTYSNDVESNLNRETAERILNSGKVNHHCLVSQGRQANSSERQMAHSSIGVQISSVNTQAEWGLKG